MTSHVLHAYETATFPASMGCRGAVAVFPAGSRHVKTKTAPNGAAPLQPRACTSRAASWKPWSRVLRARSPKGAVIVRGPMPRRPIHPLLPMLMLGARQESLIKAKVEKRRLSFLDSGTKRRVSRLGATPRALHTAL